MLRLFISMSLALVALAPAITAQTQPAEAEKTALYTRYYESKKAGTAEKQRAAYEIGKEYLQKVGAENDQYAQGVRKFVVAYERLVQLDELLKASDYAKTLDLGRQILADEPDNFYVLTKLTQAGFTSTQAGSSNLTADAITFARRALQLLDSGKVKDPSPLASLEAARAFHNIALGTLLLENSPEEAAAIFMKVLQSEEYKKEPTIYYYFGRALLKGEYQRNVAEYKQKYEGKAESPEQKALLERLTRVVERIIDTYARAVAVSTKTEQQEVKNQVLAQLTAIYKSLHNNSDAGLTELISTVLSRPMQ